MQRFLRPALRICQIAFAFSLIYFAFRLAHYHIALVTFPYANSFREGAMMSSTYALVKGLNPYSMSLQPQLMNQYGIIYPLLVWPWAKILGTTILIHRIVTAFFILASCFLVFIVLKKMAVPVLLNSWAVLMLYSSLLFPVTSTATVDPAATGMFFMLLTIFVPWLCQYSYKSLLISMVCGLLALYTKQYTFLGAIIISSYLFLFVSKAKGLFYALILLILLTMSILMVNQILPAYWDNCFFSLVNMSSAWTSVERLHLQIVLYSKLHQWTLILMGVFSLWYGFKNIPFLKNPLSKWHFPLVLYAGICSSLVLYVSLGRHTGATLWFFFQLLSPFLLIAAAWLFSQSFLWPILCVPFLIYNLMTMTADQTYKYFDKNALGWPEISWVVNQHQRILNTSLIAPLLIEQNKEVLNNGHTEYFQSGGPRNHWMKNLFKEDDRVYFQQALFFENIKTRVKNEDFDLIMLQPNLLPMGIAETIRKYYKYEGQLMVYVPQDRRPYAVTIWRPL